MGINGNAVKLIFFTSPLSKQHYGECEKTGWLGIRIICEVTCLPLDCCFSELAL